MGSWITLMVDNATDLGVFSLPGAEGLVFAADFFFIPAYTDYPEEARQLFQFLTGPEAQSIQVAQGGHIATNINVPLDAYPAVDREVAEVMAGKEILSDLDDTIGGEFQTTFWFQLRLLWGSPWQLDNVLAAIQAVAPSPPPPDTTLPVIMILSPENTTYTTSSVPLTFTVSECTSWIGYSLDGQANVTIAGNTTLSGLSKGTHSIIIYANDTAGNMGSSNTVYFTTGEISIGAILAMTGDLATFGENHKVAAEFAVGEVNEFLQASGANWTMKLVVEDTQVDPSIALQKVESLAARGIELLLGPLSSGEVRAIKAYCDANKILAISQSSTAADLAIADDFIFRFVPGDKLGQGPAIGRMMYDDGKRYIIPVTRNDAWGVGLEEAAKLKFEGLGGIFLPGIRYDPSATEFSVEAIVLNGIVTNAVATYGADQVAVWHISWGEVNAFFTAADDYPVLSTVKWYGSDGTAQSGAMLGDQAVIDFAMNVSYPCTIFAPTRSDKWEMVRQHGLDVLGREPDSYAYIVYDIVWVYALSLLEVDAYDSEAVRAVLPTVTQNYFGASGWIVLDENGDREAGDYDIWQITEVSPGTYEWEHVRTYIKATDSMIWGPLPQIMGGLPVYVFEAVWNSETFYVVTESNSTVSDYYFNPDEGPFIRFNVTGLDGTVGFCRVAIPKRLLRVEDGQWLVLVGGDPVIPTVIKEDNYYTYLYFNYSHSTKIVEITGTNVIPEFPSATILSLFMILSLITVILTKRKLKPNHRNLRSSHHRS